MLTEPNARGFCTWDWPQAQALGQALARLPTGRGSAQGTLVAVAQALVLALALVYTCGPAVG